MTGTGLLFLIAGMALLAWLVGRARATSMARGGGALNSLPSYHGWFLLVCAVVPPLLFLAFWSAISPALGHQYGAF